MGRPNDPFENESKEYSVDAIAVAISAEVLRKVDLKLPCAIMLRWMRQKKHQRAINAIQVIDEPFEYEPLDYALHQIRLCRFSYAVAERTDQILCQIQHFDLESGDCPPYCALSYVWGPLDGLITIRVNGRKIRIRRNLADFLFSVERKADDWGSWLWIDQICIDQENLAERNHQVQSMSNIYSRAQSVIAWIGLDDEVGRQFYALLKRRDLLRADVTEQYEYRYRKKAETLAPLAMEELKLVYDFFDKEYFTRLWIVQEVLLARDVEVRCGSDFSIPWQSLRLVRIHIDVTRSKLEVQTRRRLTAPVSQLLYSRRSMAGKYRLVDILLFTRMSCEKVQDRVFGLQGLLRKDQQIPVDYAMPIDGIFFKAALILADDYKLSEAEATIQLLASALKVWDPTGPSHGWGPNPFLEHFRNSRAATDEGISVNIDTLMLEMHGLLNGTVYQAKRFPPRGVASDTSWLATCDECGLQFMFDELWQKHKARGHYRIRSSARDHAPNARVYSTMF